jgi:hypothetical protein
MGIIRRNHGRVLLMACLPTMQLNNLTNPGRCLPHQNYNVIARHQISLQQDAQMFQPHVDVMNPALKAPGGSGRMMWLKTTQLVMLTVIGTAGLRGRSATTGAGNFFDMSSTKG